VTTQEKTEPQFIVVRYEDPEPADFWPEPMRVACTLAHEARERYERDPTPANRRGKNAALLDWQDLFDDYCRERMNGTEPGRE
jgi:hypothetical protein